MSFTAYNLKDNILIWPKAYDIMPVGKKDESAYSGTQKSPELRPPGIFYSVAARWLMP